MSIYGTTFHGILSQGDKKQQRILDMQIIEDLRSGNGFKHFKNRYISEESLESEELIRKKYCSMNDLDGVIKELVSYCPDISVFKPSDLSNEIRSKAQLKLVKKALKKIRWVTRLNNIYDTLESKGDCYFYIYFDNAKDKIPKLKYLEPKLINDILLDDNGEISAIIYREKYIRNEVGQNGFVTTTPELDVVWVFTKGSTQIYRQNTITKKGKIEAQTDTKGNPVYGDAEIIPNRPSYIEDLPVIRIASLLKENAKFSDIPASNYIEPSLMLDKINSNLHQVNMLLGFPQTYVIDGIITKGERKAGGIIYAKSSDDNKFQAKVEDKQITNGLQSIFEEKSSWEDNLRSMAGLVRRTLQMKLGSSDSSRVVKQLNAPMENKIELYVDNIIEAMELYFKILLKENSLYDENLDYGISFFKEPFTVQVSIFDRQIYEQNEINKKGKSVKEVAIERGDSYKEIEGREVEEEAVQTNNESTDAVRSANNI